MITGYTNNADKSANTSLEASSASVAEISRTNNEMFRQVADLALGHQDFNGNKDYNTIDKGIKGPFFIRK